MFVLDPIVSELLLKFLVGFICATVIGLERNYKGKPAGVRTCNLICLGTILFIAIGQTLTGGDPTRISSQLINGIGFIGGGAILVKDGLVEGLTTASVIWALTAISCAIGFGYYQVAIITTLFMGFVLLFTGNLEKQLKNWKHD